MRKVAVFLMIAALPLFVAAPMASAYDFFWGKIQGTYAMTATGNCLWAPGGFPSTYIADPAYSSHFSAQGIWTFQANGTGSAQITQFGISAPPIVGASPTAGIGASVSYSFEFDYSMTHEGDIRVKPKNLFATFLTGPKAGSTYTVEPAVPNNSTASPEPIEYTGMASKEWDHKTITLNSGNELQKYLITDSTGSTTCFAICNSARILVRVDY